MKKGLVLLLLCALCLGALTGCGDIAIGPAPAAPSAESGSASAPAAPASGGIEPAGVSVITLSGSSAKASGGGVSVSGSVVTIASPGEYSVSGTLDDGCIVVNTGEVKGDVRLTLDGASVTCLSGAAIRVEQAKNFDLVLADGTQNRLVSGTQSVTVEEKLEGAALFSEDDVDILGSGLLEICGYLNNGITCKDDLDILGGTLVVTAVNNGIKGSESVEISGGSLAVTAGNDGIKSSSAKKEGKGFVTISGGSITVSAGGDGIAAETDLTVTGGEVHVTTHGERELVSCKALKAKGTLTVSGGTLDIDSADHAIHYAADIRIDGGTLTIVSRAGKGLSAHGSLEIADGFVDVISADDGVEAHDTLTISGGGLRLLAGADGLKAGSKNAPGAGTLLIAGGSVTLSAHADPIDAKGGAVITSGSFSGVGTPKTPKGFSSDSSQRSLLFAFNGAGDTAAEVRTADGTVVGAIEARCGYTCAIFSHPELESGTYSLNCRTLTAYADAS